MYLSAIVIFGKEISPWWIAGGVGTGVVVAGVIIYMRNHKDDDPNFKIPKIKNPIIREPVKSANSSVKPEQITGDNYTNALRNYEQIKINKINVLNTYEEIKAFNIKEYIKPKEDLITLNNSKLKLIENRIDELKDLSNINYDKELEEVTNKRKLLEDNNNDLKFEIELLEIKYQKRLDSAFTNLKNAEVNLKEAFKLIPPEMQASESVDKIFCEVVTEPVVAQGWFSRLMSYIFGKPSVVLEFINFMSFMNPIVLVGGVSNCITNMCALKIFIILLQIIFGERKLIAKWGSKFYRLIKYIFS